MPAVIDGTNNSTFPGVDGTTMLQGSVAMPRMVLSTAQATTSGTSIDFTSIPSWVKRITVMFNGISTSGTNLLMIQLGSGSVQTTGYVSYVTYQGGANQSGGAVSSAGFYLDATEAAATLRSGHAVFTLFSGTTWVGSVNNGSNSGSGYYSSTGGGAVSLSGALDRIRLTSVGGTDTFDAGSVNILYEG